MHRLCVLADSQSALGVRFARRSAMPTNSPRLLPHSASSLALARRTLAQMAQFGLECLGTRLGCGLYTPVAVELCRSWSVACWTVCPYISCFSSESPNRFYRPLYRKGFLRFRHESPVRPLDFSVSSNQTEWTRGQGRVLPGMTTIFSYDHSVPRASLFPSTLMTKTPGGRAADLFIRMSNEVKQ